MSKNLPSQLPFLPGNVYADPTITRYHKTQLLNYKDGSNQGKLQLLSKSMTLEKTTSLQENVNPAILQSMREGNPL